jgi:hypothetical protein
MTRRKRRTAPSLVQIIHVSTGAHHTQKIRCKSDLEERSDRLNLAGDGYRSAQEGPMHLRCS